MKFWSFNDPHTGRFSTKTFRGPERALASNTPKGTVAVLGKFDPNLDSIDWESGEVVTAAIAQESGRSSPAEKSSLADRIAALERALSELTEKVGALQAGPGK